MEVNPINRSSIENLSNIKYREEGLALFFDKPDHDKYYFENYIPNKYMDNINYSASVLRLRNILIFLTILEIVSSIWGFSYYFLRRSYIYIVVNTIALLLSFLGVYSTINLNEFGLIFYCLVSVYNK